LSATVITTVLAPAVSPLLADAVAGAAVPLDRWALALRLAVFIGGAIAVSRLSGAGPSARKGSLRAAAAAMGRASSAISSSPSPRWTG
jgi:MFS-type transporter involved in bile tolerance (Atg22 family)